MTYIPKHFLIDDLEKQHWFIKKYNFGQLIVVVNNTLYTAHIPFLLETQEGSKGYLSCHVAKANSIWRHVVDGYFMITFSGPNAYISPDWYQTQNLVPTWNYCAAYVQGKAEILNDTELDKLLMNLTKIEEKKLEKDKSWSIQNISPSVYSSMKREIVGVGITIKSINTKWKLSQNRTAADRVSVAKELNSLGSSDALSVASMMGISDI